MPNHGYAQNKLVEGISTEQLVFLGVCVEQNPACPNTTPQKTLASQATVNLSKDTPKWMFKVRPRIMIAMLMRNTKPK